MNWRRVDVAIALYATAAGAIGSTLVARSYFPRHVPFGSILMWQGVPYVAWALALPLIARVVSTRSVWRVGLFGLAVVAAQAAFSGWWLATTHPLRVGRPEYGERAGVAMLIYCAAGAALWLRDESRRARKLEADLARAELEVLKLQLQPHFLFNTLQSIAVLVKKDPDAAVRVTRDLAALLRVAIRGGGRSTVAAELALVRHYLDIEQTRFGERLKVVGDVAAEAERCVVPELLLQPIVENAVRHGVTRNNEGGTVTIRVARGERLTIEVRDDGPGFDKHAEERVGLGATRRRLARLYPGTHRFTIEPLSPRGTCVRIELPCEEER